MTDKVLYQLIDKDEDVVLTSNLKKDCMDRWVSGDKIIRYTLACEHQFGIKDLNNRTCVKCGLVQTAEWTNVD